jgi:hypothetical protein
VRIDRTITRTVNSQPIRYSDLAAKGPQLDSLHKLTWSRASKTEHGVRPAFYSVGTGGLFLGVRWSGREDEQSPNSTADVSGVIPPPPPPSFPHGVVCNLAHSQLYLYIGGLNTFKKHLEAMTLR